MSDEPSNPAGAKRRDYSPVCVTAGVLSLGWAIVILLPDVRDLPAWPAASVGILALILGRLPGRVLARGVGMFMGLIGLLIGVTKIGALWGLLRILNG